MEWLIIWTPYRPLPARYIYISHTHNQQIGQKKGVLGKVYENNNKIRKS